jgi:arylsulfatase A
LKPRPIIFHFPHYTHATGPFSSIIQDDWKLIRFYNDAEGAYLLYNLADDPEEQSDLAATNPEMVDRLNRRLSEALLEMDAEMPAANPAFDPAAKGKQYNLEYTKGLAEKERREFEERLR